MRTRTPLRLASLVIVAALVAGACGGGDDEPPPTTAKPKPTTTTAPPPPAPLTGESLADEARRQRPALVLKIDNHDKNARPQEGLNQADVVFEEQVEAGVTRLAAVFQSTDADPVGPIRSGRTTDIGIVTMLNRPLFGFSGAAAATLKAILSSAIVDVRWDARPDAYRRVSGRPAPHNLFTSTPELYESAPEGSGPPPSLFRYGTSGTGDEVTSFTAAFGGSGGYNATWTWDEGDGEWKREQIGRAHVDADGEQVSVPNVIVQVVRYGTRFGNPEAVLTGEGQAFVFTRGMVIEGTWRRAGEGEITRFLDGAGNEIELTPGQTWVELPPSAPSITRAAATSTTAG